MANERTEAWVLRRGTHGVPGELSLETIDLPNLGECEVLVEPLVGCWEGNMTHALQRSPIDVCEQRGEEKVVLGNAGVVRVIKCGSAVTHLREGAIGLVFGVGVADEMGYMVHALAYDAPGTMGVLAKRAVLHERNVTPIPPTTKYTLEQWAAWSLRYVTAWSNWRTAYHCWRSQVSEADVPHPVVFGWGGGTSLAELELVIQQGGTALMTTSSDRRLSVLEKRGIIPIDRRPFGELDFDEARMRQDRDYATDYKKRENAFCKHVAERAGGKPISIVVDYIGAPVWRTSLRLLGRQGVLTTAGWRNGMKLSINRAVEAISRHIFVHTHYARRAEAIEAQRFAEDNGWIPTEVGEPVAWDKIPELAAEHARNEAPYFPLFWVNKDTR